MKLRWSAASGSLRTLVALLLLTNAARASAQAPEYQGLTGSIMLGGAQWRLDDGTSPTHFAGGLAAGYRIRLLTLGTSVVSLTPRVGLLLTRFTGIELGSSQVGFALLDVPSFQLAVRVKSVRPYFLVGMSNASIERYVGTDLVNFYGKVPSYGIGLEFPRNNPCGAGFDLALRWMSGKLSNTEWRGTGPVPNGGSIRGAFYTVGWTGEFRGTRLLFACH